MRKTVVQGRRMRIPGERASGGEGVPAWGLWQGGSWKCVCVGGGGWTSLNFVTHSFLLAPALLDPV